MMSAPKKQKMSAPTGTGKKTKRGPFSREECNYLINLVKSHWKVLSVTSKKSFENDRKDQVWELIFRKWNMEAQSHSWIKPCQSSNQLRHKWDNMRDLAKKEMAKVKTHAAGTGGGAPLPPIDENILLVLDMLKERISPFINPYDSDAGYHIDAGK